MAKPVVALKFKQGWRAGDAGEIGYDVLFFTFFRELSCKFKP